MSPTIVVKLWKCLLCNCKSNKLAIEILNAIQYKKWICENLKKFGNVLVKKIQIHV